VKLREDGFFIPTGERSGPPSGWTFSALDALRPVLSSLPAETGAILFFVPYNRVRLLPPGHSGAEVWNECKRRAAALAQYHGHMLVVDFLKPSPVTNDDEGYWDGQHVRVAVADRVVRGLAGASRGERSADYDILFGGSVGR